MKSNMAENSSNFVKLFYDDVDTLILWILWVFEWDLRNSEVVSRVHRVSLLHIFILSLNELEMSIYDARIPCLLARNISPRVKRGFLGFWTWQENWQSPAFLDFNHLSIQSCISSAMSKISSECNFCKYLNAYFWNRKYIFVD